MGIPLAIFYFSYLIFVVVFLFFTFANIYHLLRFGFLTVANLVTVIFYIFVSIAILLISWNYIGEVDWSQTIPIITQIQLAV